ncbi:ACP S-malonyltransferase [Rhodohalobacter halophilus]|uniref:ACP S-malonyltransferase n=1 Tax=Rhodohalobacter halophilus TaxID=1812810 RepID=UPI00083F90BD|nr:ACP S-malonyltransferase [Rhodohalobacter halophilus]
MKALLFPGQGSQKVGMGQDHYNSNTLFKKHLDQADEILGYELSSIMFKGPQEKLTQTKFTQPAIFVHSFALYEQLDLKPDMVAGHSLGEFSAIAAAGVLSFKETLELVSLRGKLMQEAGAQHPGTMAAIIGMDDDVVDQICEKATEEIGKPVVAANYNSPGQLVISGDVDAVNKAVEFAKSEGCRLAKVLPVSGAFHSPLMEPAYKAFKTKVDEMDFSEPDFPVYSNYTAVGTVDPEVIKQNVIMQLTNPVQWTNTLNNMKSKGAETFVEVGPGKVLQGLVKRTLENVTIEGYE